MKYVKKAIKSNWIAPLGYFVELFEHKISDYVKSKYCVAVNSGTSAIHLALKAVGVEKGDVVFVSDMTFIASANPVIYESCIPVFIDSDSTGNMSVIALKKAFKKYSPKAIIVVSLYGMTPDYKEILDLCKKNNCKIIEDSTEALGSTYDGKFAGTFGDIGCFSFNGNKIITTSGGGAIVTNNKEYADKVYHLATQARKSGLEYSHDAVGYNYRLSNISASIGVGQIETIERKIALKKKIYDGYVRFFNNYPLLKLKDNKTENRRNNYWISCCELNPMIDTKKFVEKLREKNIECRLWWKPLHTQKIFNYDFVSDEKTEVDMIETEQEALNPIQLGLFDDGDWSQHCEDRYKKGKMTEKEYERYKEFAKGKKKY